MGIVVLLAEDKLIMEGRKFEQKRLEDITKRYINEYIKCQICKSTNTIMDKDSSSRMFVMRCNDCNSKRTVAAIKSGVGAVKRNAT